MTENNITKHKIKSFQEIHNKFLKDKRLEYRDKIMFSDDSFYRGQILPNLDDPSSL